MCFAVIAFSKYPILSRNVCWNTILIQLGRIKLSIDDIIGACIYMCSLSLHIINSILMMADNTYPKWFLSESIV